MSNILLLDNVYIRKNKTNKKRNEKVNSPTAFSGMRLYFKSFLLKTYNIPNYVPYAPPPYSFFIFCYSIVNLITYNEFSQKQFICFLFLPHHFQQLDIFSSNNIISKLNKSMKLSQILLPFMFRFWKSSLKNQIRTLLEDILWLRIVLPNQPQFDSVTKMSASSLSRDVVMS